MTKVLLAHPGTQYSHRLAKQLARKDMLFEFWTGFGLLQGASAARFVHALLPPSWRKRIANRIIENVPRERLRTMPMVEWKALRMLRRGVPAQEVFHERNSVFQKRIPDPSIKDADAVIGFDTSSWILGERAQAFGKPFFLDQSISHPLTKEKIMQEVAHRFPDWQETIEARLPDVLICENQEYILATKIIVASSYTRRTLISNGVEADKIIINPYGVDLEKFHPRSEAKNTEPLRFLFLGSISARKGVPLLLEAWRLLALMNAELWLVGPISTRERSLIPKLPGLRIFNKIPYEQLPDLLERCDVLVFPSYCEGFGLVLLEALASGLPVITTEATGGPDIIQDGVEGLLVVAGDLSSLCHAMRHYADDPEKLKAAAEAARPCAERFSWNSYGDRWQRILSEFI